MNRITEVSNQRDHHDHEIWFAKTFNNGFIPRDKRDLCKISDETVQEIAKNRLRLIGGGVKKAIVKKPPRVFVRGNPAQMIAQMIYLIIMLSQQETASSGSAVAGRSALDRGTSARSGGSAARGHSHCPPIVVPLGSMVQWNNYTCAPAVLREIMLELFPDANPDEITVNQVAAALNTTPSDGTNPEAIREFLQRHGLDCIDASARDILRWVKTNQGQRYFGMLPGHAVLIVRFLYEGTPLEDINWMINLDDVTVEYLDPERPGRVCSIRLRDFRGIFVIGRHLHPPRST